MKIGLVQINPIIGDFDYNCKKVLTWSEKAAKAGCDLAIFPELVISGYPPQDLLEREAFISRQKDAIELLLVKLPEIDVIFGCFEERIGEGGKQLYNSAFVVRSGEIIHISRKQLLPSYDVFDETRYFEPGEPSEPYTIQNLSFGITVCEDIWHEEVPEYTTEPVTNLVEYCKENDLQLDGLINISASPFQRYKERSKIGMFSTICERFGLPLMYTNQVGGQDSLLFDGRSMVVNNMGEVIAKASGFNEDLLIFDTQDFGNTMSRSAVDEEIPAVYDGLVMGVRDYVRKCGFSSAVLGLSGGIDSALTCAIAVEALGEENILGVALPSPYSSADSEEDARLLAEALGCRFEVVPIAPLFNEYKSSLYFLFEGLAEDITEQNIQARIRGNLLMALSNKFGSLLLTTGNKSEMAVGYCTLYGDMSGGLAVISDVPKQLVYTLARYVNRNGEIIPQRTITKAPTAELKPDQNDQDDLPAYEILDQILEYHLEDGMGSEQIIAKGFDADIVSDVLRRIRINEYKRKQAPLGLKVTSKAFGYGRRYPNAQRFIE